MRRLFILAFATALIAVPAFAVPTSPSDRGLFDGGAAPPQASGIVTYVDLGNALDAYVTQTGLTTVLAGYLTKTTADAEYVPVAYGTNGPLLSGEYHYANGGSFTDPASGFSADAKFGGKGIATAALRVAGSSVYSSLTGSGNAYLCIDASGTLYRSATACQ